MVDRGAVMRFPAAEDGRAEICASLAAVGAPAPDALVTLQGGPITQAWGYITCAFAWRNRARAGCVPVTGEYEALPLPLHRFPLAWLEAQPVRSSTDAEDLDQLVDAALASLRTPVDGASYAKGTVFAGETEAYVPESNGYLGALRSFRGKALVALCDIGPDTDQIPMLVATSQKAPTADWVLERPVTLDSGRESTMWMMCHEVHTKPASLATPANVFRGYTRYPMTVTEYDDLLGRLEYALKRIG